MTYRFFFLFLTGALVFSISGCSGSKKVSQKSLNPPPAVEAEIRKTIVDYYDLMNARKIEESMDYLHPKFFEIIPKEMLIQTFEEMMNDSVMQFSFDKVLVQSVEGPVVHENTRYARVNYIGNMNMKFMEENDESFRSLMEAGLKMQFGNNNVTFNEAENSYKIKKESQIIAIRGDDHDRWYIVENNKEQMGLYEMLIPNEIVEKLKL